jgi:molybdenum cofactor cytidylyltransferase
MIAVTERGLSAQSAAPGSHAPGLWVVILAAGGSRRFGSPKLLTRVGGETLLLRAVRLGQSCAGERCLVVLGARASRLAAELRPARVRYTCNLRWREGLSTSLSRGLASLPRSAHAALILLADQHALTPSHLATLIQRWRRDSRAVVAAEWDGILGPPVILPRAAFAAARRQRGDAGARALLRQPGLRVATIPLPAAQLDLDTPADRAQLRQRVSGTASKAGRCRPGSA